MKKQLLSLILLTGFFQFSSAQNFYVDEDFNAGTLPTGWTNTIVSGSTGWSFGIDGSSEAGNNNIDGTSMAFFDDDVLQGGSLNNTAELFTPVFDNSAANQTTMTFDFNFRSFPNASDSLAVEVFDGTNWVTVFAEFIDNCGRYTQANNTHACFVQGFPSARVNLSAFNNANCQVRFRYHDGNDWAWYTAIDNVQIFSPLPDDIQVSEIIAPIEGCALGTTEPVTVKIKNIGLNAANNFDVSFVLNGGAPVTEPITTAIPAGDSLTYTFTGTADLSAFIVHDLRAYTTYTSDANVANDTTIEAVQRFQALNLNYTESFETANSGWTTAGINSSWGRGIPSATVISSATNGQNIFGTNIAGSHNDDEIAYLNSPCFDFSGNTADPIVTFDLNFLTEPNFDYLILQSSIDDGATWQKVGASGTATNWYNRNIISVGNAWTDNSNGWLPVENTLIGLGGQPNVKLRFVWITDGGGKLEGVGVDNFSLRYPPPVDASLNSLEFPLASGSPQCGLGVAPIIIEIENKGANPIDTLVASYQVGTNPVSFDTIFTTLPPATKTRYFFKNKFDFSAITSTTISTWIEARGDGFTQNDSVLNRQISNNIGIGATPILFFENFDNAPFVAGTGFSNNNSQIGNGWVRNPTPNQYTWNVAFDQSNLSGATGPDYDHTTGSGNFMYTEASNQANGTTANLETPCLDLTNAKGGRLEFWSFRYGTQMGPLFVDVYDGYNWIDGVYVITARDQTSGLDPWTFNQLDLNEYGGRRIKVRFRATSQGCCSGDMAIDDVLVYEPLPLDAELLSIVSPQNDCGLTDSTTISVEIFNFGTQDILPDSVRVNFQVDNQPVVTDTLDILIPVGESRIFTFDSTANFSVIGQSYNFSAWVAANTDTNNENDSILDVTITNFTQASGFIETFETFVDGDCGIPDNDILLNGWSRLTDDDFTWNVQSSRGCRGPNGATNTANTGPNSDHTTGNGKFMYIESDLSGDSAVLVSPCVDFTQNTGASVAYWYHTYGSGTGNTFIDVKVNGSWIQGVGVIPGNAQSSIFDPWILDAVPLSNFTGEFIQVRFRRPNNGGGNTGDVAIDDVEFYQPINQDARVSSFLSPVTGCNPSGTATIEVRNFGAQIIPADSIKVTLLVDGLFVVRDTIPVAMAIGATYNHTFSAPVDLSGINTTYNLTAYSSLLLDSNNTNDTLKNYQVRNETQSISFRETFESFVDGNCNNSDGDVLQNGWTRNTGAYTWNVQDALVCGGTTSFQGPGIDNTRGDGTFMYTEASIGGAGAVATLTSPCIQNATAMSFWYHRYGGDMPAFQVQVLFQGTWRNVFPLARGTQSQNAENDPYVQAFVRFPQFASPSTQIRFRAVSDGCCSGDMAIDDIEFFEIFRKDARMLKINGPVSGCEIGDSAVVSVELENFGYTVIDSDSLVVGYQVDNLPAVYDTVPRSIAVNEVIQWDFDSTKAADLSIRGKKYVIKTWTKLLNENNVINDTVFNYVVTNETKVTNYIENFESFRSASCDERLGDVVQNGWSVTSTTPFNWHVQKTDPQCFAGNSATTTANTGPSGDHTSGTGVFMYTEAEGNNAFGTAILESPCIDLSGNTAANMTFWYHKYGSTMGNLIVEATDGSGGWTSVTPPINGQTQTSATAKWLSRTVDLTPYISQGLMQVRFRATSSGIRGDMAIDDIHFFTPSTVDVGVNRILSPNNSSCNLTTGTVTAEIENYGSQDILAGNIELTFDNNSGSQVVSDTLQQTLAAGTTTNYSFTTPIDLSNPGRQNVVVRSRILNGLDTISVNDRATTQVTNLQPGFPSYNMDFENHRPGFLEGWTTGGNAPWQVACGDGAPYNDGFPPAPPRLATGPSGDNTLATKDANGDGCFMFVNSVGPPVANRTATLEMPCGGMDFTNSQRGNVLLTFWYHMFSSTPSLLGDLFIDVSVNGGPWSSNFSVIRAANVNFTDDTDPWRRWQVSLDPFVGNSDVRLRFRAEIRGFESDIAIDDVQILDRSQVDASMVRFIDPNSGCGLNNVEPVRVRVQNTGTADIVTLPVAYQVGFTPFIVNPVDFQPQVNVPRTLSPIVRETIVGQQITQRAELSFDFPTRTDLSIPGKYDIKAWTELPGDNNVFNDTLDITVFNETRPFPSCENFTSISYGDIGKMFFESKFPNNWVGDANNYSWKASLQDANGNGGPTTGHTGGLNDLYMLADDADGGPGATTELESPCFDLSSTNSANLEFYYQAPASGHLLTIDVLDGNGAPLAIGVDSIFGTAFGGKNVFTWTKRTTVLSEYVGRTIKVRFKAHNAGSAYYAIDDVCLLVPPTQQIALQRFQVPERGNCFYSDSVKTQVRVINIGSDPITTFDLVLAVDKDIQSAIPGQFLRDTTTIVVQNFLPADVITVELDLPGFIVDMSDYTDYYFNVYVDLPGDISPENNRIEDYVVTHPVPIQLPYPIDFESVAGEGFAPFLTNGLALTQSMMGFRWEVKLGMDIAGQTGPAYDHTKGNPTGAYLGVNAFTAGLTGDETVMQTRCIDLIDATAPTLKYWYHRFGNQMGQMFVEFNDDSGWETVDVLSNQDLDQRTGNFTDWKERTVDLPQYAGKVVRMRFRGVRGGDRSNMAIDDILVFDLAAKDIAPEALCEPLTDSSYCYTADNPISIQFRNNGSDSLDFTIDTTFIKVDIFKEGQLQPVKTYFDTISENTFIAFNELNPSPLPRDSSFCFLMDSTIDMSEIGKEFRFIVEARMISDLVVRNDVYDETILTQRNAGIISLSPASDPIVCSPGQVLLESREVFGSILWEEKVYNTSGTGTYFPSASFPNNRSSLVAGIDTLTDFRIKVCDIDVSNEVTIVGIKPFPPRGINDTICEPGDVTLGARVASNIEFIEVWDSVAAGNLIYGQGLPPNLSFQTDFIGYDSLFGKKPNGEDTLIGLLDSSKTYWMTSKILNPTTNEFCPSITRVGTEVTAVITGKPLPLLDKRDTIEVCQDTSYLLNAGRVPGRVDNYFWTIITPTDTLYDSSQTVVVDAYQLQLDAVYKYILRVESENSANLGCVARDTISILITDSCITSIKELAFAQQFNIYPNPVSEQLTIEFNSNEKMIGSIELLSMEGQLIELYENLDFSNLKQIIDMGLLPKGIYFIKIKTDQGTLVEKIIRS